MNQSLAIIIPCLDDPHLGDTLRGIASTLPKHARGVSVIVVDDAGKKPICRPCLTKLLPDNVDFKVYRNASRLGCAASRQWAAERVKDADWLLFIDAHMVFVPKWYEAFCAAGSGGGCEAPGNTIFCGTYISQLANGEVLAPMGGSEFFFFREQNVTGNGIRMMEHDPLVEPVPTPDSYEVPCAIGASYFISRSFFNQLRGFEGLKGYGSDEPFLSIKAWLAGGSVRVLRDVRIRHLHQDNDPARDSRTLMLYNKLFMLATLFPDWKHGICMIPESEHTPAALFEIAKQTSLIMDLRAYFRTIFKRTPEQFCRHFSIESPAEIATLA